MNAKEYWWMIRVKDKQAQVKAKDKLSASKEGARALGLAWREVAKDMDIERLRRV